MRSSKREQLTKKYCKVVLKLAVHLRVVHRPEPLIFIPTSWDTRRLIKTNASIAEQLQESTGRPIQRNYLCVCILQDTKPASRPGGLLRQRSKCSVSKLVNWHNFFFGLCLMLSGLGNFVVDCHIWSTSSSSVFAYVAKKQSNVRIRRHYNWNDHAIVFGKVGWCHVI